MFHLKTFCCYVVFLVLLIVKGGGCSPQGDLVNQWAKKFGKELYNLGQIITKNKEIEFRYKFFNARVESIDPKNLLKDIVIVLNRMMDRKMDAIRCIQQKAESLAEQFEFNGTDELYTYYSSKYSLAVGEKPANLSESTLHNATTSLNSSTVAEELPKSISNNATSVNSTEKKEEKSELPESIKPNAKMYLDLTLNNDTHFYNIPVNTTYSSVHVPTYIYDRHEEAQTAIQWSEALDEVFRQNYNSDPALSWQYFGSYSGIMRLYPGMKWKQMENDLFDCRTRTWYIEAATCTKDVIILVDNSGSMLGMPKHIASLTVYSILNTFSNNDYINVLNYSTSVNYTVPCFQKMLVQATPENIQTFKRAVQVLDPQNKSNVKQGLQESLELLSEYRNRRGCNGTSSNCNQAIMLITDGISTNLSDVLLQYNTIANGTKIPVRIFTYLINREVTMVKEITWMSCSSRGYFSHVASLEQVTSAVLNYINVIARPLVLTGAHPVSWTHAYVDLTYESNPELQINEPYRLLTSVAIPAFDLKVNRNNESRDAHLLGVAATDVPIDDIQKLSFPYKIGVNAHAFIVTNNGYVLMHPGLRPVLITKAGVHLKPNYNSVDLTEVQQLDDGSKPRQIGEQLLELRFALVNGTDGHIYNVPLKYHYNDMRRVSKETYDFYFAPLMDTPFSMGLAFPNKFGHFAVHVPDEIKRNRHTGNKLTSFFQGTNWRIHPKWVYCKYHYLEGHEFDTPEDELLHFLKRMYDPEFKWTPQYEATSRKKNSTLDNETVRDEIEENKKVECGRKTLGDDDYYCDRELINMLIFDAKSTRVAFDRAWTFRDEREKLLFHRYNATLRFLATMSGLTRWEYIFGEENNTVTEFGDLHSRATDETWYKSAVLQHQYDKESFVYSVPFDSQSEDVLVTASYAIFPKDAGKEAPASVVGFQMSHAAMSNSFFELANTDNSFCKDCVPCGDLLDCYVVDNSAYIIISRDQNDTGRFFGEIEGGVLQSMMTTNIFEKLQIYDYQALCDKVAFCVSDGNILLTPFAFVRWLANWILGKIFWVLMQTNLHPLWNPYWVFTDSIENSDNQTNEDGVQWEEGAGPYPCDQQKDLFSLNQFLFINDTGFFGEVPSVPQNCSRQFYAKRIPHSNLLLVAINTSTTNKCQKVFTTIPEIVKYKHTCHSCQKLNLNNLPRRRLQGCFNEHELEREIKDCGVVGSGNRYRLSFRLVYFGIVYHAMLTL